MPVVATLPALLAALHMGGTVVMADVAWPAFTVRDLSAPAAGPPAAPVTLDARAAKVPAVTLENVHGFNLVGGTFGLVFIDHSGDVVVTGAEINRRGVRVAFSDHVTVANTRVDGSTDQCFTYRGSSWIYFNKVECHGSNPAPGVHPDFVQSVASTGDVLDAPSHHIWVTNGVADGDTNGIVSYARTGPADTDVHVIGNALTLQRINCITFSFVVGGEITGNHCAAAPDSKFGKVKITTPGSTGIVQSGNTIDGPP